MSNQYTQEEAKAKCLKYNVIMIGTYINIKENIRCICPTCNEIFFPSPGNMWKKKKKIYICRKCSILKGLQKRHIGKKFNKCTIIDVYYPENSKLSKCKILCDCGTIFDNVDYGNLTSNNTKSCGHCDDPIIGQKFGQLIVVSIQQGRTNGCSINAICKCGNMWRGRANRLTSGHVKTCGRCFEIPQTGQRFGKFTIVKITNIKNGIGCSVEAKCDCGFIWTGCSSKITTGWIKSCGCIKSRNEEKITKILNKTSTKFKKEKTFPNLKGIGNGLLKFDFYLIKQNILIEYQGIQHYTEQSNMGEKQGFLYRLEHDKRKKDFCKEKNTPKLQIIPYTYDDQTEEIITKLVTTGELTEVEEPEIQLKGTV